MAAKYDVMLSFPTFPDLRPSGGSFPITSYENLKYICSYWKKSEITKNISYTFCSYSIFFEKLLDYTPIFLSPASSSSTFPAFF